MQSDKKVVLITGGSRGLGASVATLFNDNNYQVIVNYAHDDEKALVLKKKLKDKIMLVKADISSEVQVKAMLDEIINHYQHIDVLINNAAICLDNDYTCKTADEFNQVINTNLLGTFLVTKYVALYMKKGSIINITSTNALNTYEPYSMDYDASKAGMISLTHNFAKALAPNIRVNAIAPGWMATDMTIDLEPNYKLQEEANILLGRFGSPDEIAHVALFLASDSASYINNTIIRVDGGFKYGA